MIKIIYILATIIMGLLLLTGTRGAVLSILVFVVAYYLNESEGEVGIIKRGEDSGRELI